MSLEQAIAGRDSVREFDPKPLGEEDFSQLLWAAQGITRPWGARSAPSAGALYPLELYVVTRDGLFRYLPYGHGIERVDERDLRRPLARAALDQAAVARATAVFVIAADFSRSESKYGARAVRYATLEAGHVGQNLLLQAVALELGAVPIGAFGDEKVRVTLRLPKAFDPVYMVAVGRRRTGD